MGLGFLSILSLTLLIGTFSPFTFKISIVIYEFDPVIMMLAGDFADLFIWLLHSATDLCTSVGFCSRKEKSGSAQDTRKSGMYRQGQGAGWGAVHAKLLKGNLRAGCSGSHL